MPYPFPGMNPWLEDTRLWRGVHQRVITTLGDRLAASLEPRYFVDIETHTYVARTPDTPIGTRYPDVAILDIGGPAVAVAATAQATIPMEIDLPVRETLEEPYLEIRLVPDGEVITVIELLSHTNKRAGIERQSYLEKREAFLGADINFVEIDLLRAWDPMPYTQPSTDHQYRIFIHRKERPTKAYLYQFNLRDPIPVFALPLLPDDEEPLVDLGALLQDVYDRARYRLIVDYTQPPKPRLTPTDAAWATQIMTSG